MDAPCICVSLRRSPDRQRMPGFCESWEDRWYQCNIRSIIIQEREIHDMWSTFGKIKPRSNFLKQYERVEWFYTRPALYIVSCDAFAIILGLQKLNLQYHQTTAPRGVCNSLSSVISIDLKMRLAFAILCGLWSPLMSRSCSGWNVSASQLLTFELTQVVDTGKYIILCWNTV